MTRDAWADDPDRTTRRETYLTEQQFDDELALMFPGMFQ